MTRQKIGEYLNYCVLGALAIFVILVLMDVIPSTKMVIIRMFSTSLFAVAVIGVLTDEVGLKSGSVKKADNPSGFWGMVIFYFIFAVVMLFASFFV